MQKTIDKLSWIEEGKTLSTFHVRVFQKDGSPDEEHKRPIVIISERYDNQGLALYEIAERVAKHLEKSRELKPQNTTYLLHHPANIRGNNEEVYFRVLFEEVAGRWLAKDYNDRKPIPPDEIERDIAPAKLEPINHGPQRDHDVPLDKAQLPRIPDIGPER